MSSAHELAEKAAVAMGLPHSGHPGIPGAPQGVLCPRCCCERSLAELERLAGDAERYKAVLVAFHEDTCGCDRPSNPASCVCDLLVDYDVALEEAG